MSTKTHAEIADLNVGGRDYDLTVYLTVELDPLEMSADQIGGTWIVEAGRQGGVWRLGVRPDEGEQSSPRLVDLRNQTEGPDPLALLRALLSGQTS